MYVPSRPKTSAHTTDFYKRLTSMWVPLTKSRVACVRDAGNNVIAWGPCKQILKWLEWYRCPTFLCGGGLFAVPTAFCRRSSADLDSGYNVSHHLPPKQILPIANVVGASLPKTFRPYHRTEFAYVIAVSHSHSTTRLNPADLFAKVESLPPRTHHESPRANHELLSPRNIAHDSINSLLAHYSILWTC